MVMKTSVFERFIRPLLTEEFAHGPLHPPQRAQDRRRPRGDQGAALGGRRDPHPVAGGGPCQRRPQRLGPEVEGGGAARDGALLHVHRAGHRTQAVLRGAAGQDLGDLPERLQTGLRSGPYRPGPQHVGLPGQGAGRRRGRDPRGEGHRARVPPGPEPRLGGPSLLRQVRREGHLA